MKKRLTKRDKEAYSWERLEDCLKQIKKLTRATPYIKNSGGGIHCVRPSLPLNEIRDILTDVNMVSIAKSRYDAMDVFYKLFFADWCFGPYTHDFSDRIFNSYKAQVGRQTRRKRTAITELNKLESHNAETVEILKRLRVLVEVEIKNAEAAVTLEPDIDTARKKNNELCRQWTNKGRLIEAAGFLESIGHEKTYKVLSDLYKLVPPYETVSRKTLYQRLNRKA